MYLIRLALTPLCRFILRMRPGCKPVVKLLGQWELNRANPDEAMKIYHRAHRVCSDAPLYLAGMAACHTKLGEVEEAEILLARSVRLNPTDAHLWFQFANLYYELDRHKDAVVYFQHATQLSPRNARYHFNLGHALKSLNQNAKALEAFQRAFALAPRFTKAQFMCAFILAQQGRNQEAISIYNDTLRKRPKYLKAIYNIGNCHLKLKQYDLATQSYQKALLLEPHYPKAHFAAGQVMMAQAQHEKAAEHFVTALALQSDFAMCRLQLARCYEQMEQPVNAQYHYRVLQNSASDSIQKEASRRLDTTEFTEALHAQKNNVHSPQRPLPTYC